MAGDVKSYAERLFDFVPIGSLAEQDAVEALVEPAKNKGVRYSDDAVKKIFELTEGYPYFIQEFGKQVWQFINNDRIDIAAVDKAVPLFFKSLDNSFFIVRLAI